MVELASTRVHRELYSHPVFGSTPAIAQACEDGSLQVVNALLDALLPDPGRAGVDVARDPGVRMLSRLAFRCLDGADLSHLAPGDVEVLQAMIGVGAAARDGAPTGLAACVEARRVGDPDGACLDVATRFTPLDGVGAVFEDRLRREFLAGLPPWRLTAPTHEHLAALEEGLQLLSLAFGKLADACLAHVRLAFVMAAADSKVRSPGFGSFSADEVPGVIFLGPQTLVGPLAAVEHVLHEATHCKLYDLCLTRSVFRAGHVPFDSPRRTPPWRSPDDIDGHPWGVDRTLAAAHVYVHLAAFYVALTELGHVGAEPGYDPPSRARLCWDRARWLVRTLDDLGRGQMGSDGEELVAWLADLLPELGSALPSIDSAPGTSAPLD